MSNTLEVLRSQVLSLPTAERVRLLDTLVASLDADAARDEAWDAVAARREAEIDQGFDVEVPLDEALVRARAELG